MRRTGEENPITTDGMISIPVLPVADIYQAADWYEKALELKTVYLHEGDKDEATNYAVLQRDGFVLHLILDEPPPYEHAWTRAGTGYLYLAVRDVDQVFSEVEARDVEIARGLQTENWGARGFNLTDPSGNAIHIEQHR